MSDKKSVLIINRTAPYGSSNAREALDVALTCSIFEMPVSLLFTDDGVYQLINDQNPGAIAQKNLQALLSSLPMYDIDQIYISETSANDKGLDLSDLSLPAQVVNSTEIAKLIQSHDTVLTF